MKKAGIWGLSAWIIIAVLTMLYFTVKDAKSKDILMWGKLSDKGLYVKDFDGTEHKADLRGDDLYVGDEKIGTRVPMDVAQKIENQ